MQKLPTMALSVLALAFSCSEPESAEQKLISQMTLDEKVHMLVGTHDRSVYEPERAPQAHRSAPQYSAEKLDAIEGNTAYSDGRVRGAAGDGYAIPRLGIPSLVYSDGPAGVRIDANTTAFPTGTILSASWDTTLVRSIGEAIGNEALEFGVDIMLCPGMNIQRNPLCGRNFEYYSEDPLLTGKTAAAMVKGIQSNGVGTSVKHFAANSQELYRNGINSVVSERALREIYLRGFEIAVKEARPWTVMTSYNKINGTFTSENRWLIHDVLRGEWGFDGFVMTDWWGADDPVAQMKAGNDLLMPGSPMQIAEITEAVQNGVLDEAVLDENLGHMLGVIAKSPAARGYKYSNEPDFAAHAALTRSAASQGMVLLSNSEALPLAPGLKVALLGCGSYDTYPGGSGSGWVNRSYKVNIVDGLREAGYELNKKLESQYAKHIRAAKAGQASETAWFIPHAPELNVTDAMLRSAASTDDIAVLTISRMAGESGDRSLSEGDYLLSATERSLIKRAAKAFHARGKKVVVLLNMGSAIEFDGWQDMADAVLFCWLPGQEAGNSVADVLSGKVNPSGKLPMTIAAQYADIPSSGDFGLSEGEINAVRYEEDLMVGYRHFVSAGIKPAYAFGHGLSYTTFEYSGFEFSGRDRETGALSFKLTVANTGSCSGRETVQIYVAKPTDDPTRPAYELCSFAKTGEIAPGGCETLEITVDADELRQFENGVWAIKKGSYSFYAAAASDNLKCNLTVEL